MGTISEVKAQKPKSIEEITELVVNMVQPGMHMGDKQAEEFRKFTE